MEHLRQVNTEHLHSEQNVGASRKIEKRGKEKNTEGPNKVFIVPNRVS